MAIDPVCKMDVNEETAEHKTEYEGKTYYFCAADCKSTFEADPKKFLEEGETMEMSPEAMETKPKKKWWQFWK
ncbi:MAG: YHS domain-containing protein [Methanosarcinales archaeon]